MIYHQRLLARLTLSDTLVQAVMGPLKQLKIKLPNNTLTLRRYWSDSTPKIVYFATVLEILLGVNCQTLHIF